MNNIIKLSEEKVEDILSVITQCSDWMATHHNMDHWSTYYNAEVIKDKLKHGDTYVEYTEGLPVATISLSELAPEYYISNTDGLDGETLDYTEQFPSSRDINTKPLYISALGVIPDQQGSGLASKLLKMAENEAIKRGCNVVRFDSRMSFEHVINFYVRKGYQKVGTMDDEGEEYGLFEKRLLE